MILEDRFSDVLPSKHQGYQPKKKERAAPALKQRVRFSLPEDSISRATILQDIYPTDLMDALQVVALLDMKQRLIEAGAPYDVTFVKDAVEFE